MANQRNKPTSMGNPSSNNFDDKEANPEVST